MLVHKCLNGRARHYLTVAAVWLRDHLTGAHIVDVVKRSTVFAAAVSAMACFWNVLPDIVRDYEF